MIPDSFCRPFFHAEIIVSGIHFQLKCFPYALSQLEIARSKPTPTDIVDFSHFDRADPEIHKGTILGSESFVFPLISALLTYSR